MLYFVMIAKGLVGWGLLSHALLLVLVSSTTNRVWGIFKPHTLHLRADTAVQIYIY
jgi:hypothetical protein